MATELAGAIQADLSALANEAHGLAVVPAIDAAVSSAPPASFTQSMKNAIASVDNDERLAAQRMNAVDSGKSDDLVGAMLASQQANLSFSMLLQVRNKVMGAVDDLLKLPV
jgi:flagellar hook-basal body complex protein FliE